MPRPRNHLDRDLVEMLAAAAPRGLSRPELESRQRYRVSQPTLCRALLHLRARGEVVAEGEARARRYHYAGGRLRVAELRSRRLHEIAARRLVTHPELLDAAEKRLAVLGRANPQGGPYQARWAELLAARTPDALARLARIMTEDSEDAAALRRESPFTALIPRRERERIFKVFAAR